MDEGFQRANYFEWETIGRERAELARQEAHAPQQITLAGYINHSPHPASIKGKDAHKEKRAIRPSSARGIFYMAGLLRQEASAKTPVFTIITREAASGISHIHDRMPLILKEGDVAAWLGSKVGVSAHQAAWAEDDVIAVPANDPLDPRQDNE
jgi:putative SOS response-associated peptidase YedK